MDISKLRDFETLKLRIKKTVQLRNFETFELWKFEANKLFHFEKREFPAPLNSPGWFGPGGSVQLLMKRLAWKHSHS